MATKKYKFTAEIHSGRGGGAYVLFPYDVEKEFGTKGRVPVQATLDGVPETTSLIKYGSPQHMMVVLRAVREKIEKSPGDTIEVVLWKDEVERVLEVPAEFETRMKDYGTNQQFRDKMKGYTDLYVTGSREILQIA